MTAIRRRRLRGLLPGLLGGLLLPVALGAGPGGASPGPPPGIGPEDRCPEPEEGHARAGVPAPDLYCVPLQPTALAREARGRALLRPTGSPFTVGVDRHGVERNRFVLELEGLPDPGDLGDFDRYVAWLTPPTLHPMIRLGRVRNGRNGLGEAGFNAYLILVSAEGPEPGEAREGPLVLRGTSPSLVLRPHDLPYILGEMAAPPGDAHPPHHHPAPPPPGDPAAGAGPAPLHLGHGLGELEVPGSFSAGWTVPPMHPEVDMPPQMMRLRPEVRPFSPSGGADALAGGGVGAPTIPEALPRGEIHLAGGDTLVLEAGPVRRTIGGVTLPGYGFNRQIPGPLIRAREGDTVHVRFRNDTPVPSAIHWHGIRLDNPFDGVPGVTQDPVPPGGEFLYEIRLPDEGTYWYHPHLREDVMQDMGLAGNLRVTRTQGEDPYNPVDRTEAVLLDDHLLGPDGAVPYGLEAPSHALMGRFGNVLLADGREAWSLEGVRPGEVVRFHFTNAASTRTFNLSFGGLPMKLVAGDVGKLPREVPVESVVIAPAERWTVEVRFPETGRVPLENRVQALDHMAARFFSEVDTLGTVTVKGAPLPPDHPPAREFDRAREARGLLERVEALVAEHAGGDPDHTLLLTLRTRDLPFPLDPLLLWESTYRPPVEWAGTMPDMDWLVSGRQAEWVLRDPDSGAENMEVDWRFRTGELVRIRLVNDRSGLHPMQHPVHIHGQRFLVLSVNGEPNPLPTWKDTVLVPTGAVVDILVEMSNPGAWMIHCHISEHLETGMMALFDVH